MYPIRQKILKLMITAILMAVVLLIMDLIGAPFWLYPVTLLTSFAFIYYWLLGFDFFPENEKHLEYRRGIEGGDDV